MTMSINETQLHLVAPGRIRWRAVDSIFRVPDRIRSRSVQQSRRECNGQRERGGRGSTAGTEPSPSESRLTEQDLLAVVAGFAAGGTPEAGPSQKTGGEHMAFGQAGRTHS